MEYKIIQVQNWITKKVPQNTKFIAMAMVALIMLSTLIFWNNFFGASEWMAADAEAVLKHKEYWRLWTALLAHGDIQHLLSNLFLFFPFAYFLSGHFGKFFFPFTAFLMGGITNYFVILLHSESYSVIGVSGVVYWMGAAWATLAFLLDKRQSFFHRLVKNLGVSMILFLPDVYKADVSYASHAIGFLFGMISGAVLYFIFRKKFKSAEVYVRKYDKPVDFDWQNPALAEEQNISGTDDLIATKCQP